MTPQAAAQKIVIAHRGASGYLPEHTLEAKAMAHAMGVDYIEQDVVMTRDNELIVLHDITLDRTTDVAEKFPERARPDGRYYAIDFTLAEIRQLQACEGFRIEDGHRVPGYPDRFPLGASSFRVPSLREEIELIQGLNKSTGRDVGIYPEIKQPEFHREEGRDISTAVVEVLKEYGYRSRQDRVFLQTFSFLELEILKTRIFPAVGVELNLIQLIDFPDTSSRMVAESGMVSLARFADGIGPAHTLVIAADSSPSNLIITPLVKLAHDAGMLVHAHTFRSDPGQVPQYAESFEDFLHKHYFDAGVDGVFTDFPDKAVQFLDASR